MDPSLFLQGLVLGFSIAAIVGPIALLCLRRTLTSGFLMGFVSGLGAATADASYGAVAAYGISAVANALVDQRLWLRLIGGLFLLILAVRTLRARPAAESSAMSDTHPLRASNHVRGRSRHGLDLAAAYTSTLALTLSNPMTILSFGAIFAGLGLGSGAATSAGHAAGLVVGVFVGSAAWWLVLATVTSRLRTRFTPARMRLVNVGSGLLIFAFAVQSLATAGLAS